ncbi:hypothetical protein [Cytobacillus dafuensis]|nr:hypothetical protein [Cytobacillus dafuensis]
MQKQLFFCMTFIPSLCQLAKRGYFFGKLKNAEEYREAGAYEEFF